jgi:ribonuclease PH
LTRIDGRSNDQLRPVTIETGVQEYAEGSVMISTGDTRVLCAVSVENRVPPFLRGQGKGWITAEYAMLPRATLTRSNRESRTRGRTHEIQRLIGRSLRAIVDMKKLGEVTLTIDCDVIQADGGTRTASITGAYVALHQALEGLQKDGKFDELPLKAAVAATSVGLVEGVPMLDLCYTEDYQAQADVNIVMTDAGEFVEVQGTAEENPFTRKQLDDLLGLAEKGINELFSFQQSAIG